MNTDQINEEFVPVIGYEDRYEISNYGRLKSLPKWNKNRLSGYMRAERFLRPKKGLRDIFNMNFHLAQTLSQKHLKEAD